MKEQFISSLELDALDLRILAQLQRDASLSNQDLAATVMATAATCFRRVRALRAHGLIERELAILNPDRMALALGHGLTAIIEVSLDQQASDRLDAFEARAVAHPCVQQCYRTSPGPDFVLVVHLRDMPGYHALTQSLFASNANVRNVRAFFSVKRAKFEPALALA